jgi:hypothetical protein
MRDALQPDEDVMRQYEQLGTPQVPNESHIEPQDRQVMKDYRRFIETFGDVDPVFFEFDIIVESLSSLPMDMQSLANLMIRLYSMKAVDRRSLLETLKIPRWQEIAERMDKLEQQMMQRKGSTAKPPQQGGIRRVK